MISLLTRGMLSPQKTRIIEKIIENGNGMSGVAVLPQGPYKYFPKVEITEFKDGDIFELDLISIEGGDDEN